MTATEGVKGVDVLIYVNVGDASTPDWKAVGGQQGATLSEERETVEFSNKNSPGRAREFDYGFYQWTLECEGIYVPDDESYAALAAACRNGDKVKVRLKEGDTYSMEGEALVISHELEAPYDDATTYAVELQGTGPLTTTGIDSDEEPEPDPE